MSHPAPSHSSPSPRCAPLKRRVAPLLMAGIMAVGAIVAHLGLPSTAQAQQYDWTNDVPDRLRGTWVVRGERCEDPNSQLAIFSDGGYRWRKSRTDWGFARGKYSYQSPVAGSIYFRVQRFIQQDQPDFSLSVSGIELKKYSYGSGDLVRYEKCRK